MYHKDFDQWNTKKKNIDKSTHSVTYAKEREVFLCSLGLNIGREQNGNEKYERPAVIVKRFNSEIAWVIPLTTKQKDIDYYYNYTDPNGLHVAAILAQLRLISTKRLIRKLYVMDEREFEKLKSQTRNYLL